MIDVVRCYGFVFYTPFVCLLLCCCYCVGRDRRVSVVVLMLRVLFFLVYGLCGMVLDCFGLLLVALVVLRVEYFDL